jgi:hypothetical protein
MFNKQQLRYLRTALKILHDSSQDELAEKRDHPGEQDAVRDCQAAIFSVHQICEILGQQLSNPNWEPK